MEFQYVISGVLLYAQRLSGFAEYCEPLEGEARLVSRPWNSCPYCQQSPPSPLTPHPIPSLVGELGAVKWKIFQTLIVKPLTLTSPCERSSKACVFFGFSPDSRKM